MRDFWESLILAFLLAIFIRLFIFSVYKIPSSSMAPTLWPGDFILVSKLSYGIKIPFLNSKLYQKVPQQGDLVVFEYPDKLGVFFVKRVIGLPGDHIVLRGNQLIINDTPVQLKEVNDSTLIGNWSTYPGKEYLKLYEESGIDLSHIVMHPVAEVTEIKMEKTLGPFVVPPGEVFVLGDNRGSSDDSRYWGTIPLRFIEGKVLSIWLSLDFNNKWAGNQFPRIRSERFFHGVH